MKLKKGKLELEIYLNDFTKDARYKILEFLKIYTTEENLLITTLRRD